jgi:hypothetical protein
MCMHRSPSSPLPVGWSGLGRSGEQGQGQGQRRLEELSTHDEAGRRLEEAARGDLDVWKN